MSGSKPGLEQDRLAGFDCFHRWPNLAVFDSGNAKIWTGSSAVIKPLLSRAQLAQMEDLSTRLSMPTGTPVLGLHKQAQRIDQYCSLDQTSSVKYLKASLFSSNKYSNLQAISSRARNHLFTAALMSAGAMRSRSARCACT
jgi:hypothetical protein